MARILKTDAPAADDRGRDSHATLELSDADLKQIAAGGMATVTLDVSAALHRPLWTITVQRSPA